MSSLILVFEPVHCAGGLFKQVLQLTVQWDHDLNQEVLRRSDLGLGRLCGNHVGGALFYL